mmetsp:Transcript_18701/g.53586  ORF Transcript_18701/g.53586 Transcript_18701/m.53586 type:complete len:116 (+) Transcript_18701:1378-1725(+)
MMTTDRQLQLLGHCSQTFGVCVTCGSLGLNRVMDVRVHVLTGGVECGRALQRLAPVLQHTPTLDRLSEAALVWILCRMESKDEKPDVVDQTVRCIHVIHAYSSVSHSRLTSHAGN